MRATTALLCAGAILQAAAVAAAPAPEAPAPAETGETPPFGAPALAPQLVNYQVRLTDAGGAPLAGPVKLTVRLYDVSTGGSALWTESHGAVALDDGVASVLLGSLVTFPANAFSASPRYLGISIDDGAEMTPRLRLTSVPFALEAERLQGKTAADFEPKDAVLALSITDGSPPNTGQNRVHWNVLTGVPEGFVDGEDTGVTAHDELTGLDADDHPQYARRDELGTGDGTPPNVGSNLVHWDNIVGMPSGFADSTDNRADGTTDHGELEGLEDDDHPQYATDADLAAHEAAADPHPGYVEDGELDAHAADPGAHHAKTVDASELTAGELDPARIPAGAIDGARLADGAVTAADFAPDAVTGAAVADGSLTGSDLAAGSVNGDRISAGTITAGRLAVGAVDSTRIADGGVSTADLAAGAVDGTRLAPGAVTGASIQDGSIASADVENNSLTMVDLKNESGVEQGTDADGQTLNGGPVSVLTQDILCPDTGWVLAVATGQGCILASTAGGEHALSFSVSDTENTPDPAAETELRVFGLSGIHQCAPLVSQKLYTVSAGVHTFHIVADGNVTGTAEVSNLSLSLIYFGTHY